MADSAPYEQEPVKPLQEAESESNSSAEREHEVKESVGDEEVKQHPSLPYDDLADLQNESLSYTQLAEGVPLPPIPAPQKDYLVQFLKDDPEHPERWNQKVKASIIVFVALSAMCAAGGSAIISGGVAEIKQVFHVGTPVAALTVSLYVAGFAVGPVFWGPFSELVGRRIPMIVGLFGFTLFAFAAATAKDYQTLCLSRFFMGVLGASTITVGPAIAADVFNGFERGKAVAIISLMITAGPMLAPVVGGYIGASYLGWRWTQYITGIISSLVLVLVVLFLKETYPAKLLEYRAAVIREETGNWAISAPLENQTLDPSDIVQRTILKPIIMLFVEPILLMISLYHGLVYGILYLCLEAVPLIFTEKYHWRGGNIFLPYLAMLIGATLVCLSSLFFFEPIYQKKLKASGKIVVPEERLPLMIVSGVFFPIGIFLMCWAGNYHVQWIVPFIGLAFLGYGLMGIFMSAFNYIIDSYLMLAASGIAANTFLRSGFGAAFPLFATAMFKNLGIQWAGTLLGCLATIIVPVPVIFYIYGERIRTSSKYAVNLDEAGPAAVRALTNSTTASRRASRVASRPNSFLAV